MLILHTSPFYPPEASGVSEVVWQLSMRLARRGHEVHVATAATKSDNSEERRDGVMVHRFRLAGNAARGIAGNPSAYVSFLHARPWDVVSMHCAQTWTTDLLLPHLRAINAARILVGHGLSLNDQVYKSYYEKLSKWMSAVDRIVSLSRLVEVDRFCSMYGLPEPEIIPNGVDVSQWESAPLGVRAKRGVGGRPWLVCVSNHYPIKAHHVFFEVVRAVRKHIPEVRAAIIGRSYPAWRWGLGRFGIKGGCWYRCMVTSAFSSDLRLETDLPRADVISAIKEADILLSTSSWEASSLSMLEGMAAGTPWLSFDVGAARENAGGIVVSSQNEMIATVLKLLKDPEERKRLGREGRERIALKHDWELIASQYEQLYQHILSRKVELGIG